MKVLFFTIFLFFLIAPTIIFAAPASADCKILNYSDLVFCLEKTYSAIQISNQEIKESKSLDEIAQEFVNPELATDTVMKGAEKSEINTTLFFTLRLGNKRNILIQEASSEIAKTQANSALTIMQTRLDIMLMLYRLSQLKNEISIEEESTETFSKIVNQFEKRPALTPEQDVSLSLFKMTLSDHKLKLLQLKSQEEKIYQTLTSSSGLKKDLIQKNLPTRKPFWPEIESFSNLESSPRIRKALAELKIAESLKDKAKAESIPDLKIGPTIRSTKDSNASDYFIGLSFSIPLPVLNQNTGMKSLAEQKKITASMNLEQVKRFELETRDRLEKKYNQTVATLKNLISSSAINENHEKVEKQFFKGLVATSLVIEAHRQLFDLEERRNISELEALEALGQILIIDNNFNEVVL